MRGSGRGVSVLRGVNEPSVSVDDCESLAFEDLTIHKNSVASAAVDWSGAGDAQWTDVDVIAENGAGPQNHAWLDRGDDPLDPGGCNGISEHEFRGARVVVRGATISTFAFGGHCSEVLFQGGEIRTELTPVPGTNTPNPSGGFAANLFVANQFSALGTALVLDVSVVQGIVPTSGGPLKLPNVLLLGPNGATPSFTMHGGAIDTRSSVANLDVIGLAATGSGVSAEARTEDTAFTMDVTSAIAYRAFDDSTGSSDLNSPFFWGASENPPQSTDESPSSFASLDGLDMYVETDCTNKGNCGSGSTPGSGDGSHVMLLDAKRCPSEKWFNLTTRQCRGVTDDTLGDLIERVDAL